MQANVENKLIDLISPLIAPLGYEVVHVEVQNQRQKILRLFIDFLERPKPDQNGEVPSIGIKDCIAVTKALDSVLDLSPEVEAIFKGTYELEVSSPGVDRPLRQKKDYQRFEGRRVKLHTFRSLSESEIGNAAYFARNPKQKNFIGVLKGLNGETIRLEIIDSGSEITIPLSLVSKANLEPVFEI